MVTRRDFVRLGLAGMAVAAAGSLAAAPGASRRGARKAKKARGQVPRGPQRILILGGTGFLGPHLVEAAQRRGHVLTLFNRGKTRPHLFPDIEKLHGDRDGKLEELAGRSWDAVVDTSGYVPRIVKMSADLLGPNVRQYVFISTLSVYADTSRPGADESAPVATIADETSENVQESYGALKALSERAAEASMPGRVTNVRPGLIVGPGDPTDRFTYWPVRVARGGEVLAPGTSDDPVQFIDARDLADFCITCIEKGTVGVFNAVGPASPLGIGRVLSACKEASGSDARFTWVDAGFLEANQVSPWADMPVWVPPSGESAGFARISARRAIDAGLRFRTEVETVTDTLAWWKTLPEDRRAKVRAGLSAEREAEVLAKWRTRGAG